MTRYEAGRFSPPERAGYTLRAVRERVRAWGPRLILKWALIVGLAFGLGSLAELYGFPAPHLFAAAVVGLAAALRGLARDTLPPLLYMAAQAVTGVVVGAYFNLSSLAAIGGDWLPVVVVTSLTLGLSIAGGILFSRVSGVDRLTASLGMIAGGSAAIVAASDEMEADSRLVALMQYMRLVLVVVATPLLVRFVLSPSGSYEALGPGEVESEVGLWGYLATPVIAAAGAWIGSRLRVPLGALVVPLLLTAGLASLGAFPTTAKLPDVAPEALREIAFMLIGLEVGLRFTPATLRRASGLVPVMFVFTLALVVVTGLLAWGLTLLTKISLLNAYLATTPGGINAIVATAYGSQADAGFVFAVQALRLVAMVLIAPPLVRWLVGRTERKSKREA